MKIRFIYPLVTLSVAAIVGVATTSSAHALSAPTSGDPALIQAAQAQFGSQYKGLSVAKIDTNSGTIKYANFGATNNSEYEIGSVSKTFVGLLLADSISRGEVTEQTKLYQKLPISSFYPSAQLTLAELASHRSGLPSMPSTPGMAVAALNYQLTGANLVPFSRNDLLTQTRMTFYLPNRGSYQYSNMGASLEGHAIATAAGTNYKTLLQNRALNPMQLTSTRILFSPNDITASTSRGTRSDGMLMQPYAGEGYAPAATMRSTIADMGKYAMSVMRNEAPGMSALTPRWSAAPGQQVGYNWFIDSKGRAWHNGLTGGSATMFMLDKTTGKGIVVLSNTAVIVDNGAIALLENPNL